MAKGTEEAMLVMVEVTDCVNMIVSLMETKKSDDVSSGSTG